MTELANIYRLLESDDPDTVALAVEIAKGMDLDWGLADYQLWSNIIGNSYNIFPAELPSSDIFNIVQSVHKQGSLIQLTINKDSISIPSNAERLIKLERLILNSDGTLYPLLEQPYLLAHCKEISFKGMSLTEIPEHLYHFKALEKLDLSHNLITEINDTLGELDNLQSLQLQFNRLNSLPESFLKLKSLKTLWIAKNEFTALPNWLPKMKNLTALYIFDNPLDLYKLEEIKLKMPNCSFYNR